MTSVGAWWLLLYIQSSMWYLILDNKINTQSPTLKLTAMNRQLHKVVPSMLHSVLLHYCIRRRNSPRNSDNQHWADTMVESQLWTIEKYFTTFLLDNSWYIKSNSLSFRKSYLDTLTSRRFELQHRFFCIFHACLYTRSLQYILIHKHTTKRNFQRRERKGIFF